MHEQAASLLCFEDMVYKKRNRFIPNHIRPVYFMQEVHALKNIFKKLFTHCQLWWHYRSGKKTDNDFIFAALLRLLHAYDDR